MKPFTKKYVKIVNKIMTDVFICDEEVVACTNSTGLWDTGASCSAITEAMALKLNLVPQGQVQVSTPSGGHIANQYYITIRLPNDTIIPRLLVLGAHSQEWDMLIGMDVITMGDFAVTNYASRTTFSFCIPSKQEIDFEEEIKE